MVIFVRLLACLTLACPVVVAFVLVHPIRCRACSFELFFVCGGQKTSVCMYGAHSGSMSTTLLIYSLRLGLDPVAMGSYIPGSLCACVCICSVVQFQHKAYASA